MGLSLIQYGSVAYTYKNIGMLRMQELFFWVGGLIETF